MSDVNERIAKALGCKREVEYGQPHCRCDPSPDLHRMSPYLDMAADWESDLNACMKVIRAKWPRFSVQISGSPTPSVWLTTRWTASEAAKEYVCNTPDFNDTQRLAEVLAEALEAENE